MSCLRAGWNLPKFDECLTTQGLTIRLDETCLADIDEMAKRDAEAERWEEWTSKEAYRQLAPAPLVEPLRRLCVSKRRGWCRRPQDTFEDSGGRWGLDPKQAAWCRAG